jgi:Fur family iron response transcriptional regulator
MADARSVDLKPGAASPATSARIDSPKQSSSKVTPQSGRRRPGVVACRGLWFMDQVCGVTAGGAGRITAANARFHVAGRQAGRILAPMALTDLEPSVVDNLNQRLLSHGVRPTAQRLRIASLLLGRPQHLSAEQVLEGLRNQGLRVSKATIYNTLNLFAASGLIRQLSVGNDRCWFDSNTDAHYHFHDLDTGALMDVSLRDVEFQRLPEPPAGMQVDGIELIIRLRRKSAA